MKTPKNNWGTDKPLAAHGLVSYRYRGSLGWIMIGALNNNDALIQANRSLTLSRDKPATIDKLEIWDGNQYVAVVHSGAGR